MTRIPELGEKNVKIGNHVNYLSDHTEEATQNGIFLLYELKRIFRHFFFIKYYPLLPQ